MLYGDPIRWERIEDPTREQQQEVADGSSPRSARSTTSSTRVGRRGVKEQRRRELRQA